MRACVRAQACVSRWVRARVPRPCARASSARHEPSLLSEPAPAPPAPPCRATLRKDQGTRFGPARPERCGDRSCQPKRAEVPAKTIRDGRPAAAAQPALRPRRQLPGATRDRPLRDTESHIYYTIDPCSHVHDYNMHGYDAVVCKNVTP